MTMCFSVALENAMRCPLWQNGTLITYLRIAGVDSFFKEQYWYSIGATAENAQQDPHPA